MDKSIDQILEISIRDFDIVNLFSNQFKIKPINGTNCGLNDYTLTFRPSSLDRLIYEICSQLCSSRQTLNIRRDTSKLWIQIRRAL